MSIQSKIVNKSLAVSPILFDFNPALKIDSTLKKRFHILTRIGRNLFADDYQPFATMNTYDNLHFWMENGKVVTWNMMNDEARGYRMTEDFRLEPSELPIDTELGKMKSYLSFLSYVYQKGLYNEAGGR